MDGEQFDGVVRDAVSGVGRRNLLRGALGAFGLAGLGLLTGGDDADAKKKKKKKNKKKPVRCTSSRPITCGPGCCPSSLPVCCEDAEQPNADLAFSCNPSTRKCCPVELGGGTCATTSTCCGPTLDYSLGSCASAGEVCCPGSGYGSSCPTSEPVCCRNDACCPTGNLCPDANDNCPVGYTYNLGCCEI